LDETSFFFRKNIIKKLLLEEDMKNGKIKIAHVTTVDLSLRSLLLNLLQNLQASGFDVFGISSSGIEVPFIEGAGIKHIPLEMSRRPFTILKDLKALFRLWLIFRREKFLIVHTHSPKAGFLGRIAARLADIPIIIHTVHGFHFHDYTPYLLKKFYILLEKIAAACCDLIFSVNQEDIAIALKEKICAPSKIVPLGEGGIGIDLKIFNPEAISPEAKRQKRRQIGIPDEAQVIGFVGRLAAKRKGFLDFLKAAQEVVKKCPHAYFLIVGEPDYGKEDAVEPEKAKEYGLWEHCKFVGWRASSEMPSFYSIMDILALPSLFEGIPRAIMEAAAMGVPVVATNVKGNREVVIPNQNGLLVPFGDVTALAEAMVNILSDPEKAKAMGRSGRQLAEKRFDEKIVFGKIKREYFRLLKKKKLFHSGTYNS